MVTRLRGEYPARQLSVIQMVNPGVCVGEVSYVYNTGTTQECNIPRFKDDARGASTVLLLPKTLLASRLAAAGVVTICSSQVGQHYTPLMSSAI